MEILQQDDYLHRETPYNKTQYNKTKIEIYVKVAAVTLEEPVSSRRILIPWDKPRDLEEIYSQSDSSSRGWFYNDDNEDPLKEGTSSFEDKKIPIIVPKKPYEPKMEKPDVIFRNDGESHEPTQMGDDTTKDVADPEGGA